MTNPDTLTAVNSTERQKYQETIQRKINSFKSLLARNKFAKEPISELPEHPRDLPWVGLTPEFLNDLEEVGFSNYDATKFMKLLFDNLRRYSQITIEIAKAHLENKGNRHEVHLIDYLSMLGHTIMHTMAVYAVRNPKPIPKEEHELHKFGQMLSNLPNIGNKALTEASRFYRSIGKDKLADTLDEVSSNSDGTAFDTEYGEVCILDNKIVLNLQALALVDFFETFPTPFLSEDESIAIVKELVGKLEKSLEA